jgi:anaerobic ribonucleoside-triphosphate reductase activating protein
MNIRIFGLQNDSIVDGPGIRFAIFTQGCYHNCPGCHNPQSHDMNGGTDYDVEKIIQQIKTNPLLDGITLTGGEPFLQAKPLTYIAEQAHRAGLNVMAYTGYLWEDLLSGANEENGWRALLEEIDILVDGPFIETERSLELQFKGSRNQRAINVPKSLEKDELILHTF